jgi:hypothetical protein
VLAKLIYKVHDPYSIAFLISRTMVASCSSARISRVAVRIDPEEPDIDVAHVGYSAVKDAVSDL